MACYSCSLNLLRSATKPGKNLTQEEKELVCRMAAALDPQAVSYVVTVRDNHPDKYREFLRILEDHRNQRIGIAEVASRANALFRDSPGLIDGFNAFLPEGYTIKVGVDEISARFVRDVSLDDHDDHISE